MIYCRTLQFLLLFFGTLAYSYLSYVVGSNSDNMSSLLMAKDFADGNYLLHGWNMSTQSYFYSDMIWTSLVIKIIGFHPLIAHIIPGFFFSIVCLSSIKLSSLNGFKSVLLITPIILVPTKFTVANADQLNIHIGIYTLSALALIIFNKKESSLSFFTIFLISLLFGAFAESDKLILFIFILPVLLSSLFHSLIYKKYSYLKLTIFSVLCLIFYKIFGVLNYNLFEYITPGIGRQGLATTSGIMNNAKILLDGFFRYFGVSTKDTNLTLTILRVLFLTSFVIGSSYSIVKRWNKTFIDTTLVAITALPIFAFIFSTVAIDESSTRFVFFSLSSSSILLARTISFNNKNIFTITFISIILLSIINLHSYHFKKQNEEQFYTRLGKFLEDNNLKYGYSGFWSSAITSAVSNVKVYPVDISGYIKPKKWLSKDSWYDGKGNFFISTNLRETKVAKSQFGIPDKSFIFENIRIMVWKDMPIPPNGYSIHEIYKDSLPTVIGTYKNGSVISTGKRGFLLFGPYMPLKNGNYTLKVEGSNSTSEDYIDIIDNSLGKTIYKSNINFDKNGYFYQEITINEDLINMEVRIFSSGVKSLEIKGYSIVRK